MKYYDLTLASEMFEFEQGTYLSLSGYQSAVVFNTFFLLIRCCSASSSGSGIRAKKSKANRLSAKMNHAQSCGLKFQHPYTPNG